MRLVKSIRFKAAFLLMVFSLNTMISFACSVGIDMGFNSSHHAHNDKKAHHSHGDKHSRSGKHRHTSNSHSAVHKHADSEASGIDKKDTAQKDDCCTRMSVELQKHDKSAKHYPTPLVKASVLMYFLAGLPEYESNTELSPTLNKSFIPQYYPPPDKRIIIQSFQI